MNTQLRHLIEIYGLSGFTGPLCFHSGNGTGTRVLQSISRIRDCRYLYSGRDGVCERFGYEPGFSIIYMKVDDFRASLMSALHMLPVREPGTHFGRWINSDISLLCPCGYVLHGNAPYHVGDVMFGDVGGRFHNKRRLRKFS